MSKKQTKEGEQYHKEIVRWVRLAGVNPPPLPVVPVAAAPPKKSPGRQRRRELQPRRERQKPQQPQRQRLQQQGSQS